MERQNFYQIPDSIKRVLVVGGGQAAMQIIDILWHDPTCQVVGCLDDDSQLHGQEIFGVPILGGSDLLEKLWREKFFTAAIVGVGINLKARAALYQRLKGLGIPLVNAIDPTVRHNRQATLGEGIVLCSFVHVGVCAHIGDNSFIGAHSSIDHHCQIGSTVFMGPGCLLSGTVRVGSGTLFGSGVLVQLGLTIGEGCRIASGVTVIKDLPAHRGLRNALHQEIRVLE